MKKNTISNLDENQDILISTKERPIWQKILAAVLFTLVIACLYLFLFEMAGFCFVMAVRSSLMKDYYFDLKNRQYKIVKRVGLVEIGKWKDFQDLDYVSVFKNGKGILEINLWYNENNHFNMGTAEDLPLALTAGKKIAQKLQIDLLDAATNPHDSK